MRKMGSYGIPLIVGVLLFNLYSVTYHTEWYTKSVAKTTIALLRNFELEHLITQMVFPEIRFTFDLVGAIVLSLLFTAGLVLLSIKLKTLAYNSQFITLGVLLACIAKLILPIIVLKGIERGAVGSLQEMDLTLFTQLQIGVVIWYLPLVILVLVSMRVIRIKT
ncbi:hypothetical protein VINI7043_29165 [Vibrio nigripulchritudo ATCC 27043]|uniref:hypothetical protein n=1 Tax=Vibrio nigripulchritudo TaxID=28173 RepID=UPI00021C29D2|nr:hypothetical protein [Vibrio nigripulchritudo]EGU60377.1 hypothetical protein VINI7043_29165 [Vibrio nigripulchritudo ATCC 27043]